MSCAARLGLTAAVRTAMSETEIMARLAERPSDVLLVDTALTRPDSAGFTRRALVRAPGAIIVLIGAEDRRVAEAAVGAGARALIRNTDDLVGTVAKAILLLGVPARPVGAQARTPQAAPGSSAALSAPGSPAARSAVEDLGVEGRERRYGPGEPVGDAAGGLARVDSGEPTGAAPPGGSGGTRRVVLTERELQVLRGMAEGKSNAEIGRDLCLSEDTVKTHARRLFRKLGVRDRAQAVAHGFRRGLVS